MRKKTSLNIGYKISVQSMVQNMLKLCQFYKNSESYILKVCVNKQTFGDTECVYVCFSFETKKKYFSNFMKLL